MQIEAMLGSLDLWDLVSIVAMENQVSKRRMMRSFELIIITKTSKDALEILKKSNEGIDKVKKIRLESLRAQFESLQQENSEKVAHYFSQVITIVHQMRSNFLKLNDI